MKRLTRTSAFRWLLVVVVLLTASRVVAAQGSGGPPKIGEIIQPPGVVKKFPAISLPPSTRPKPLVGPPVLPGPIDMKAPLTWHLVDDGTFETEHPYASNTSVWKPITLPLTGKLSLTAAGTFALEANYDYLEVWRFDSVKSEWEMLKRYTGTSGPLPSDEFEGHYFTLHLAADPSVTAYGFKIVARYRR